MSVSFTFFSETDGWLDVPNASTAELVQVQRFKPFHGGPNQLWNLVEVDEFEGEFYTIQNVNSGLMLDVESSVLKNNTPIIQFHATGNDNQLWRFERLDQHDRTGFIYLIHPRHSGRVMDVAPDGKIQLHDTNANPVQSAWLVQAGRFF